MRVVDTALFDKTGTLTQGKPALHDVGTTGVGQDELRALTAAAETDSGHPWPAPSPAPRGTVVCPSRPLRAVVHQGSGVSPSRGCRRR